MHRRISFRVYERYDSGAFFRLMENTLHKYIIQRLLQLIPVLIGITFLSFAMMRVAGSDAITELYGDKGRSHRKSSMPDGRSSAWISLF